MVVAVKTDLGCYDI